MAFLFVVGVYGLVGLGLLWVIEKVLSKEWQCCAWLPQAGKRRESEATKGDREPARIAAREMECPETPQ